MTGTVVGYDPGGNGKHGLAWATVQDGRIGSKVNTDTFGNVEEVLASIRKIGPLLGLGIDTLTCWSTGDGGWRPADHRLRTYYDAVKRSVIAPNSLAGSMIVSGMAVLLAVRRAFPGVFVTETHPKVLYYELSGGQHHDYGTYRSDMHKWLRGKLASDVAPRDDHQWDAAISILPVVRWLDGSWQNDLHAGERLVRPCDETTAYVWPTELR
ncbi:MAG: hypothetical protein OXK77_12530 [Gemmatimonadota bacterium]|nr:hypothetical protein [Gemmatimonadota bacterium]MDE2863464.1 hypothetical protein [Gemmatimonadota bacterium]